MVMKLAPKLLSLLKRYVPTGEIEGYRVMFRLAERVKMIAKPERTGSFDSI